MVTIEEEELTEVTFEGDEITQITMDGDVLWESIGEDFYLLDDWRDNKYENRDDSFTTSHKGKTGVYRPEWDDSEGLNPTVEDNKLKVDGQGGRLGRDVDAENIDFQIDLNLNEVVVWEMDVQNIESPGGGEYVFITQFAESDTPAGTGTFEDSYQVRLVDFDGYLSQLQKTVGDSVETIVETEEHGQDVSLEITRQPNGTWDIISDGELGEIENDTTYDDPLITAISGRFDGYAEIDRYKIYSPLGYEVYNESKREEFWISHEEEGSLDFTKESDRLRIDGGSDTADRDGAWVTDDTINLDPYSTLEVDWEANSSPSAGTHIVISETKEAAHDEDTEIQVDEFGSFDRTTESVNVSSLGSDYYIRLHGTAFPEEQNGDVEPVNMDARFYRVELRPFRVEVPESIEDGVAYWPIVEGGGLTFNEGIAGLDATASTDDWTTQAEATDPVFEFDGVDNDATVPHDDDLTGFSEFTFSAWVYNRGHSDKRGQIISKYAGSGEYQFGIDGLSGTNDLIIVYGDGDDFGFFDTGSDGTDSPGVPTDEWTMVTMAVDMTTDPPECDIYHDTNFQGTDDRDSNVEGDSLNTDPNQDVFIGSQDGDRYFDGHIQRLVIDNTQWDSSQVEAYYDDTEGFYS